MGGLALTGRASSRQPESSRLLCSTQLDSASFCGPSQKGLLGPFMSPKLLSITHFQIQLFIPQSRQNMPALLELAF